MHLRRTCTAPTTGRRRSRGRSVTRTPARTHASLRETRTLAARRRASSSGSGVTCELSTRALQPAVCAHRRSAVWYSCIHAFMHSCIHAFMHSCIHRLVASVTVCCNIAACQPWLTSAAHTGRRGTVTRRLMSCAPPAAARGVGVRHGRPVASAGGQTWAGSPPRDPHGSVADRTDQLLMRQVWHTGGCGSSPAASATPAQTQRTARPRRWRCRCRAKGARHAVYVRIPIDCHS